MGNATSTVLEFAREDKPVGDAQTRAERQRLDAQAQASRDFIGALGVLAECGRTDAGAAEIMEALDRALACAIEAVAANDGAVLIKNETTGDLVFTLVQGVTPQKKLLWRRIPDGHGVVHWVAKNRRPAIVNNTSSDERFCDAVDRSTRFHTHSIVAVPIVDGDEAIGVIEVINKRHEDYFRLNDQHHLSLLAHLAAPLLVGLPDRQ